MCVLCPFVLSFQFLRKPRIERKVASFCLPYCGASQVDEQRELAVSEMRSHREFSHPNLMPLKDWAFVRVPQGEAAFLLFPYMDREFHSIKSCTWEFHVVLLSLMDREVARLLVVAGHCVVYLLLSLCVRGS